MFIPKTLRDELHLSPGDALDLTVKGDEVTLRPRRSATPLQKERGVWVFRSGESLTAGETEETLRNIRAPRHRQNAVKGRPPPVKAFLDTSVLVATFYADHEHHRPSIDLFLRFRKEEACCAAHSLAEVYVTLTGHAQPSTTSAGTKRCCSSATSGNG